MYKRKISATSPGINKSDPSPDSCSPSNQNITPHQKSSLLTPCRSMGLKRKSIKSPLPCNPAHLLTASTTSASCSHFGLQTALPINISTSLRKEKNNTSSSPVTSVKRFRKHSSVNEKQYPQNYLEELKERVAEKQKKLSAYKLDPKMKEFLELQAETEVWRKSCQQALEDLLVHVHAEQCSDNKRDMDMMQLLKHINIPPSLVNYNEDNQEFL